MKEFLEYLIKEITSKPNEVAVTEIKDDDFYTYSIHVSEEDMGVVIGKEGKTIKALRNLAKAKAIKDNIRIQVILEEVK
ncbi:KH domain-containing protein [candidate division WWE3 bacterium]|uniref:RNA-binding protein KhpA n=1 Tax=candidate division WWE3 bacterium TaxID=2053526 RepID=A0A7X9HSF8_UNCKA|nr:KH domain-containing protein [candidate division WWE3 bacterium]